MSNNSTFEYLDVNVLKTEDYNRKLEDTQQHAKHIAVEFDATQLGTIEVSLRDGFYHIVDGQNRVLACRIVGHNIVGCKVHHGLTKEQEARLFYILNSKRFALKAAEKLNGLKVAKDEETMRLYGVVGMNNFRLSTSCGPNQITAVGALLRVVRQYGLPILDGALRTISAAWGGDQESLKGDMIEGMSVLTAIYGEDFKRKRAIEKLSQVKPGEVFKLANQDPMGGMKKFRMARALLFFYNHSAKFKLDASRIK